MKPLVFSMMLFLSFSCNQLPKKQFEYEPSIAAIIHKEQMEYLDQTIAFYSTLSETGENLYKETKLVELKTYVFREQILKGETIGIFAQQRFFDDVRQTFNESPFIDYEQWENLRNTRLRTVSEVDMVEQFIKTCYFQILNDMKVLPFNTFGIDACPPSTQIKYGDPFTCDLSVMAYNSTRPFEWHVTDGDGESRLADTLRQGEDGRVIFSTTNYRKGTNTLQFRCNVKNHNGDQMVMKQVTFFVK